MNQKHEANRRRWNAASPSYAAMGDRQGNWRKVVEQPGWAFLPEELAILGEVAGKRACVLGSGDNLAVFALAGMGAEVTSVDISDAQIDVARGRAETLGLDVRFLRADVTEIDELADDSYDIVHTSRHIAVWVSDLRAFYRQAVRILKPGGLFFVTEYHPFRRIFKDAPEQLEVESSCGIPGYRARIRPIVSRITIHWPSFYNVVTGKTLALPNLIALQHIPLSPAGVIAKRPAPIALPNSCAAEWRMAPDAVFSPYASVRYFTPHMVHSQYNLL